jgi:hypothetical protein
MAMQQRSHNDSESQHHDDPLYGKSSHIDVVKSQHHDDPLYGKSSHIDVVKQSSYDEVASLREELVSGQPKISAQQLQFELLRAATISPHNTVTTYDHNHIANNIGNIANTNTATDANIVNNNKQQTHAQGSSGSSSRRGVHLNGLNGYNVQVNNYNGKRYADGPDGNSLSTNRRDERNESNESGDNIDKIGTNVDDILDKYAPGTTYNSMGILY